MTENFSAPWSLLHEVRQSMDNKQLLKDQIPREVQGWNCKIWTARQDWEEQSLGNDPPCHEQEQNSLKGMEKFIWCNPRLCLQKHSVRPAATSIPKIQEQPQTLQPTGVFSWSNRHIKQKTKSWACCWDFSKENYIYIKKKSMEMVQKVYWIFNLQKSYPYEVFYAKLDKINCI